MFVFGYASVFLRIHNNGRVNNVVQEMYLSVHTLHCEYLFLIHSWKVNCSVDELRLRPNCLEGEASSELQLRYLNLYHRFDC